MTTDKLLTVDAELHSFTVRAWGETWFTCPIESAVDRDGEKDTDEDHCAVFAMRQEKTETGTRTVWHTRSNLWEDKEYVLETADTWARFYVRVFGSGSVDALRFFIHGVRHEASDYMMAIADHADYTRSMRFVTRPGAIELGYYGPPPYCYPFRMEDCEGWVGVGLAAREGQYNFHQFLYQPRYNAFCFEVPLNGQTSVRGEWESQSLLFLPGTDGFDVVRRYSQWHYDAGWCRTADHSNDPAWWKGPIFCGWSEQGNIAAKTGGSMKGMANQESYEWMSTKLDEYDLHPSMIMIDDKWQGEYGTSLPDPKKWPDMRAFTDAEHKKGRRVVLWFRSWYPEGLPEEECIEYLCTACGSDPTSRQYQARMREIMHTLLSDDEGCCNCDGFKIDFSNCMPLGKYVRPHEPVYGVELLKRYLLLLRESAKAVKPDALINCSVCHPYFAEIADQIRLHDYVMSLRSAPEIMGYRAKLARAVYGDILIDTDGAGGGTRRDFRRFLAAQPKLGIPTLYFLTGTGCFTFNEEDIDLIRECWKSYAEKIAAES